MKRPAAAGHGGHIGGKSLEWEGLPSGDQQDSTAEERHVLGQLFGLPLLGDHYHQRLGRRRANAESATARPSGATAQRPGVTGSGPEATFL